MPRASSFSSQRAPRSSLKMTSVAGSVELSSGGAPGDPIGSAAVL